MNFLTNYMTDSILRHKLNALTQKTFYFDFESWVTKGYFQGDYIPYSFENDGEIISNVSANIMKFNQNGCDKTYIQIGTVMTDQAHRNKGLASKLMKTVIDEYKDKCDGIYLFGDLGAVDFYKKLGFNVATEHAYSVKTDILKDLERGNSFKKLDVKDEKLKEKYLSFAKSSAISSAFEQTNKFGLQLFYTSDFENVYYSQKLDCFIVAEIENEIINLQSVLYQNYIPLEKVISEIGEEYKSIKLGFVPLKADAEICNREPYDGGDDYRLFYYGSQLEKIETEKLYFPALSHA